MNKKLLIFMITICIVTSSVCASSIKAEASYTPSVSISGSLEVWAASKILTTLYHLAGVAWDYATELSIWDGGKLDVEQAIENIALYDVALAKSVETFVLQGVAGATTLTLDRLMWNKFKDYVRDEYGTDTSVSTVVGTITSNLEPIDPAQTFEIAYTISPWGYGSIDFNFDREVYVFRVAIANSGNATLPETYVYYFVPLDYLAVQDAENFRNGVQYHKGNAAGVAISDPSTVNLGNVAGYAVAWMQSSGSYFSVMDNVGDCLDLGIYPYDTSMSTIVSLVAEKVASMREVGSLTSETDVSGKPLAGVDGQAATQVGQDVIGYGNTATQEGEDVVIGGDLAISLPADVVLEDILKRLAEGTATYEEYVEALGAVAVKTADTTAEDIQEKEETIVIAPPITGTYTVSLNDLFPFCIPFDLYDLISALNAEPVAPEVTIALPVQYDGSEFTWEEYTLSLEDFEPVAEVVRVFEYILFCIGLMLITRKLIEG